jgi:dTDP-4-amino-4,6-dideoxy-D-glucose acyltransferase
LDEHYYSPQELIGFGFASVGHNVRVSRKVSLYAISGSIGSSVRIDDFSIIKGRVTIRSYVHIGSHCSLSGARGQVDDCTSLSTGVSIFTGSDDYRGDCLNGPMVPQELVRTISGDVRIGRGVVVGAHAVLLPGIAVGDAATIGACCVINADCEPGGVYVTGGGRPRRVHTRDLRAVLAQVESVLDGDSGPG